MKNFEAYRPLQAAITLIQQVEQIGEPTLGFGVRILEGLYNWFPFHQPWKGTLSFS